MSSLSDRRVALAALIALVAPLPLMAQTPTRPATAQLPTAQACDMSMRALTVSLVDARTGAPVSDASVSVRRKGASEALREAIHVASKPGDWIVVEDGDIARDGKPVTFELVVRHAGRTVRHAVEVAADAAGCHVAFTRSPGVLRI